MQNAEPNPNQNANRGTEQPPEALQMPPSLLRNLLFPYSGAEVLSSRQGWRIILTWSIVFPLVISVCVVPIAVLLSVPWYKIVELFLLAFLSGMVIFGLMGLMVVSMNNRAVHIRQIWLAQKRSKQERE